MNKSLFLLFSVLLAFDFAFASSLLRMSDGLTIHMLDVGQGDAMLLVTPEQHHILVDGGPGNSVLVELGEVLPYLFGEIDLIVVTHPHQDHIEGLVHVLDRFEVGAVMLSLPEYNSQIYEAVLDRLEKYDVQVLVADDDRDIQLGSTYLDVLYPFEANEDVENVNNISTVIMLESESGRILLTGDADLEVEEQLLDLDLKADVMKAGHHGSRTSNTLELLEAVAPEVLLISAGEGNSYGHPHPETLEKAAELGIEVLRTDLHGRISIYFGDYSWTRSIFAPRLRSFSSSRS